MQNYQILQELYHFFTNLKKTNLFRKLKDNKLVQLSIEKISKSKHIYNTIIRLKKSTNY